MHLRLLLKFSLILSSVLFLTPTAYAVQVAVGSYTGNSGTSLSVTGVGFSPDAVIIKGENDQQTVVRTSTMVGDATKQIPTANALVTDRVISLDADGFTVGSNADVNAPRIYYWIAFKDDGQSDFKAGSYVGNGVDHTYISGVGFPPDYVMILTSAAERAVHRSSAVPGDSTLFFNANGSTPNLIEARKTDGFQVGTDSKVNSNGIVYHYIAWRARKLAVGSYTGNGGSQNIGGVGAQPVYVIVKDDSGANAAVQRFSPEVGDQTLQFNGVPITNGITSIGANGFTVGSDTRVNQLSKLYYWMAFTAVDTPTPTIDNLSPNVGLPGTSVTVNGWSFGNTAGVLTLNGVVVTTNTWTNTSITFTVPDGASTGPVVVTTQGKLVSQGVGFMVNFPSPPIFYYYDVLNRLKGVATPTGDSATYQYDAVGNLLSIARATSPQVVIFGFTPTHGSSGAAVTIYGANFSSDPNGNTVQFNGVQTYVNAVSPTELSVTVPPQFSACGTIIVATSVSSATSADNFCP